jgi:hypothetical protein
LLISSVSSRSRKKKKRRLFWAALVAGTVNKLEQSILRLRYLWFSSNDNVSSTKGLFTCPFTIGLLHGQFYSEKLGPEFVLLSEVCPRPLIRNTNSKLTLWWCLKHRFERITRCTLTIISESAICNKFLGQIWFNVASL